jgi:2-polyprenyl-6-methoxyphenol hydroxylase-like FAD-dependent oxidoreductase
MIIGVAGAGMGGLAVAAMLARDGHEVVLHDRMERPGPVGSGFVLQPTGLAVLDDMGLRRAIERRGSRIDRMLGLVRPSGATVLDVGYPEGMYGLAVQRAALFDVLLDAAVEAGVSFETSRSVGSTSGCGRSFVMQDGRSSAPFDLLVDAMGSGSPLRTCRSRTLPYGALWATVPWSACSGFDPNTLEQRYLAASRMAGVLPVGTARDGTEPMATFFWSVRHDEDPREDSGAWREAVHRLWPEASGLVDHAVPTLARYRHHTHARPVAGRLVRIGDAFHATSPQLGQGANMALIDTIALRTALRNGGDLPKALSAYAASRRLHVGFYQSLSIVLTPFYQSYSRLLPILRDRIIAPLLRRRGIVNSMIAAMVTGGVLDPVGRATHAGRIRTGSGSTCLPESQ